MLLLDVDEGYPDIIQPRMPLGEQLLSRMDHWRSQQQHVEPERFAGRRLHEWLRRANLINLKCETALSSSEEYSPKVMRAVLAVSQYAAVGAPEELRAAEKELRAAVPDQRRDEERALMMSIMFVCKGEVREREGGVIMEELHNDKGIEKLLS